MSAFRNNRIEHRAKPDYRATAEQRAAHAEQIKRQAEERRAFHERQRQQVLERHGLPRPSTPQPREGQT